MMLQKIYVRGGCLLALAGYLLPSLGVAQTENQAGVLEEIVVKATKREQSAQDIAITVNAFSGEELRKLGIFQTKEVVAQVPNMQLNNGIGLNAFNIRGIGSNDFQTNIDSPVAVHVDEVYLSKTFMNKLVSFDLASVEIAKGPQGTLNGRNTTGGTVSFYTNKPTKELEAGVLLTAGNYDTRRLEGFISGPLGDSVQGRLSVIDVDQGEGFYNNLTIGGTEGRDDYSALRGQLNWDLTDQTSALLSLHTGRDTGSVPPYDVTGVYTPESYALIDPAGGVGGAIGGAASGTLVRCEPYNDGSVTGATAACLRGHDGLFAGDADPFTSLGHDYHNVDHESYGGSLRFEHEYAGLTFTSLSAYEYYERDQEEVGDNSAIYTGTWIFWYSEIEQFTQEFRLNSNGDGPLNYVAGLFYEKDELYTRDYLTLGFLETPGLGGFDTDFDQNVEAIALFGNANYDLTDEVTLTLGLRYSQEETDIQGGTCFAAGIDRGQKDERPTSGCLAQLTSSENIIGGNKRDDSNTSYVASLDWAPVALEDTMIYGSISSGFRSGGFNADLATEPGQFNSLSPEEITAYELGFKSTFNKNTMRLEAALFYYDFEDGFINVDNPQSPVPYTINAAGLKVTGLDVLFQWLITDNWRLDAGLGLLDAEISSDKISDGESIDGNRPVNSPESSFNAALSYGKNLGNSLEFEANINFDWRSEQYFETNNKPVDRQDAYGLANAYVGINSGRWQVGLWGKNITDEEYKVYVNDLPVFGWSLANYGDPRTYGITIGYSL